MYSILVLEQEYGPQNLVARALTPEGGISEQNPSSYVIGTDLSAIQPIPRLPNVEYIKTDAEDEWVFTESNTNHSNCAQSNGEGCLHPISFDYIHLRMMFTCFREPLTVMKYAFQNLTPGGWIEFQDARTMLFQANQHYAGDALQRWSKGVIQGAAAMGRDVECVLKYERWLKEAGLPANEWHSDPKLKKVGLYMQQNMSEAIHVVWKMLRKAGMTPNEIDDLTQEAQRELLDPTSHPYAHYICAKALGLNFFSLLQAFQPVPTASKLYTAPNLAVDEEDFAAAPADDSEFLPAAELKLLERFCPVAIARMVHNLVGYLSGISLIYRVYLNVQKNPIVSVRAKKRFYMFILENSMISVVQNMESG
ncbi:hypothetical protein BX600DRAFT_538701 [Xylariales sp. PMI_506]|nr:hypothetical protein BX600DRAFT_538701 [Xylariales sp. PMI_506]